MSVPPGTLLEIERPDAPRTECSLVPPSWYRSDDGAERTVEAIGAGIRTAMMQYLEAALAGLRPKNVYVCLSGGLDSSGIAAMTRELFPSAVAVSFDMKHVGRPPSDDRLAAAHVARDLGLPLLDVSVTADELLDHLDTVLVEGVDWRDFNVHAALVNAVLAFGIAGSGADESSVVLTGDLANEFLVDYHEESYRGRTYYRLPRLRPGALRSSLVRGLDSCNREIGIFEAYGLGVVQPYRGCRRRLPGVARSVPHRRRPQGRTRPDHLRVARPGVRLPPEEGAGSGRIGRSRRRPRDLSRPGDRPGLAAAPFRGPARRRGRERARPFHRAGRYRTGIPSSTQEH